MLKVSMNVCLLTAILILTGFGLLYEPLSMSLMRYAGVIFTVSFFFVPVVVVFNGLLGSIRSLKLHPGSAWMMLLVTIMLISHFIIGIAISLFHIHPVSAELVWLILNTSMMLALLMRIKTIHHLFKTFYHGQDATYSVG